MHAECIRPGCEWRESDYKLEGEKREKARSARYSASIESWLICQISKLRLGLTEDALSCLYYCT